MPERSPHSDFIKTRLPAWLTSAAQPLRNSLRASLIRCNQTRHDVQALLSTLQSPEDFARPILARTLQATFFGQLDAQRSVLVREWKNHHLLGLIRTHASTTEQPLIAAALQNFEPAEAEEDGMEVGSALYTVTRHGRERSPFTAVFFAQLCRNLDIGGLYLKHIEKTLAPAQSIALLASHEANQFEAALHEARMKGELSDTFYRDLLILRRDGEHPEMLCNHLTIGGVVLANVLVIRDRRFDRDQVLYTPNDPVSAFRRHPSMTELESHLATRLTLAPYRAFFTRLLPRQYQGAWLTVKPARVNVLPVGSPGEIVPASLEQTVTRSEISGSIFQAMAHQRIAQIKRDARAVAVPTADADLIGRQKRLHALEQAGLSLLMFAASFIPVVGEVLLAVSAAQLVNSVYNGFTAWARGDSDEALNDLLDVADTAALAVATAGAVKVGGFCANLVNVELRNRGQRLWNPDLAPYRALEPPPAGIPANAQGLYEHEGQHFVKLDGHAHAVKFDSQSRHWQVQHPNDVQAYTPSLLGNGSGAWREAHEHLRDWPPLKLIERLGPDACHLREPAVEPILLVSGVDTETLRQVHQHNLRPPPLLRDTLKHFNIQEEILGFGGLRAEGLDVTPLSGPIQFHLVCSLPEWPTTRRLQIVDTQQRSVLSHGLTGSDINVPLARFRAGDLLHCLEDQLSANEFNALMPNPSQAHLSKVENLALRLSDEARRHATRLFNWLVAHSEEPTTPIEQDLRRIAPALSKSYLEEMAAVLGKEEAARLHQEKSLTVQQQWELERYLAQAAAGRVREGIFVDASRGEDSLLLMLSTLEGLPGWPASTRIDVQVDAARYQVGPDNAQAHTVLERDAQGSFTQGLQTARTQRSPELFDAIGKTLEHYDLEAILRLSDSTTLKHAIRKAAMPLMARTPWPPRAMGTLSGKNLPAEHPLDPLFAVGAQPQGLTLLSDNVYQQPSPAGGYHYFVHEGARYFEVKRDPLGWRLLDARSRFRAYQPYLLKTPDGGWRIDALKGNLLGGMPDQTLSRQSSTESSGTFETAHSPSDFESAEEAFPVPNYSLAELRHMRTQRNYQHSQNYRGLYDRANNGRYPLRDLDGASLKVITVNGNGIGEVTASAFSPHLLWPYLQMEGYEKVARLYEEKLEIRTFTEDDKKSPQEANLIGQATVAARRSMKKGEFLGVYGGELLPKPVAYYRNDPYLMDVCPIALEHAAATSTRIRNREVVLSGDNILSRINTLFEYEGDRPVRQAIEGYNAEVVYFDVAAQKGSQPPERLRLTGFALLKDLPAGTELRWNYGYDEATIGRLFGHAQPQAQQ